MVAVLEQPCPVHGLPPPGVTRLEEKTEGAVKVADVLKDHMAAISVGVVLMSFMTSIMTSTRADVDMNIVMTGKGELAEVQGTGEESTYTRAQLNQMLDYTFEHAKLIELQKKAIAAKCDRCGSSFNEASGRNV